MQRISSGCVKDLKKALNKGTSGTNVHWCTVCCEAKASRCYIFFSLFEQRNEVRSTFNLWSTLLAETRRMARDRSSLAENIGLELVARIDIMSKDVAFLARKVIEINLF